MKIQVHEAKDLPHIAVRKIQKEPSTGGASKIVDNRPSTLYQRKLIETLNAKTAQATPLQRKVPKGTSRFQQIAISMGEKYGVDTSALKATHNSSFPGKLNAEATTQGNNIHFAPGMDTDYNIKHEVSHAIDNTINGTPRGDTVVNGQNVDTTREKVVDAMARNTTYSTKGPRLIGDKVLNTGIRSNDFHNTVIQRAVLKKKKLNIVGEHHPQSGFEFTDASGQRQSRRKSEKEFCRIQAGSSNYWREGEFEVNGQTGDPENLRFLSYVLLSVQNTIDSIFNPMTGLGTTDKLQYVIGRMVINGSLEILDKTLYDDNTKGQFRNLIDEISSSFMHLASIATAEGKLNDGKPNEEKIAELRKKLSHEQIEYLDQVKNQLNVDVIMHLEKMSQEKVQATMQALKEYAWELLQSEYINTGQGSSNFKSLDKRNLENFVRILRSASMDSAARKSDKLGVWKVGQAHVDDIRRNTSGNYFFDRSKPYREYHLVDWWTFDKAFLKAYPQFDKNKMDDGIKQQYKSHTMSTEYKKGEHKKSPFKDNEIEGQLKGLNLWY